MSGTNGIGGTGGSDSAGGSGGAGGRGSAGGSGSAGFSTKGNAGASAKKEMRRRIRALRESLSEEEMAFRSQRVLARLTALEGETSAASAGNAGQVGNTHYAGNAGNLTLNCLTDRQVFALYYPTRNEVDVRPLVNDLWRRKKVVVFPRICPDTNLMEFRQVYSFDDFTAGSFKLMEPDISCSIWAPEQIEVVIVPGVAFDLQGYRIGFGGGYYDRFLPALKQGAIKIAPVFEFQIIDELPHEEHDQKVDWLVSEARLINAGQA